MKKALVSALLLTATISFSDLSAWGDCGSCCKKECSTCPDKGCKDGSCAPTKPSCSTGDCYKTKGRESGNCGSACEKKACSTTDCNDCQSK